MSSVEALEARLVMATAVDLSVIQSANLGTEAIGPSVGAGAGYTVTDVGNVTGSGYDSYVVAAPSVTSFSSTGVPLSTGTSAIYLVLGTKAVGASAATGVANLTAAQRAFDLATLGATNNTQVNPTVVPTTPATPGFQYDGLKFVTSSTPGSQLGASVAALGDINGDGFADFMVGAPSDTNGGRAYIIYGGSALQNQTTKTIDLEPTAGTTTTVSPTKVLSFSLNSATAGAAGTAVSGIGNFFSLNGAGLGVNNGDVAIGAPTYNGTGAVFAISGNRLNNLPSGTNTDLTTIGTTTNPIGETFLGVNAGDLTGSSVANAGDFDGSVNGTSSVSSLLIGAPGFNNGAGAAYLVYGNQLTPANLSLGTTQSLSTVGVAPTTVAPITTPLSGIVFLGAAAGSRVGFSVASAGDFNSDGLNDIVIGGPGSGTATGFAAVVYGQATTTTTARINGVVSLNPAAASSGFTALYLTGETAGDLAGYSLAPTTTVFDSSANGLSPTGRGLLIGAPGYTSGTGAAYYLNAFSAGATGSTGTVSLTSALYRFTATNSAAGSAPGFGSSVSGRPSFSTDTTVSTGDLFFGAPGFSLTDPSSPATITRALAGAEYTVSSLLLIGAGTGGGGTGGGGTGTGSAVVVSVPPSATDLQGSPIFTGVNNGQPFPTLTSLSHLSSYKPLPVQLAYQQFRPAQGFLAREAVYHNGGKGKAHQAPAGTILGVPQLGRRGMNEYNKVNTLPHGVFTRGKFKVGKVTTFTHKVKVIPRSEQTQTFPG